MNNFFIDFYNNFSHAFYHYAIRRIEVVEDNTEVLAIYYGYDNKHPLYIFKKDTTRLVRALISQEEIRDIGIQLTK